MADVEAFRRTTNGVDIRQEFTLASELSTVQHRRLRSTNTAAPTTGVTSHRRGASALPTFTFNAADASGLHGAGPPGIAEDELASTSAMITSSSHKRNASELVGHLRPTSGVGAEDARGVAPPNSRRTHRYGHSRSRLTLSSHDLSSIMAPQELHPRPSSSLPTTPSELPNPSPCFGSDTNNKQYQQSRDTRLSSRPKVEFSDDVEYISRPLSTISSETTSSVSTMRGHSVSGSISSILSSDAASSPSARLRARSLGAAVDIGFNGGPRSSIVTGRRMDQEGQWLRAGHGTESTPRPLSEPVVRTRSSTAHADCSRNTYRERKTQSIGKGLGFVRRKSEPAIGMDSNSPSCLSAVSSSAKSDAQPSGSRRSNGSDPSLRGSSKRLKDWALFRMNRKSKEFLIRDPTTSARMPELTPQVMPQLSRETPEVETDLEAVFGGASDSGTATIVQESRPYFAADYVSAPRQALESRSSEDLGIVLDLDAALDTSSIAVSNLPKSRQGMHSSRGTRDFHGPGGHYQPYVHHRRAESAPMLVSFDQRKVGAPPQALMADVFEEDEEDSDSVRSSRTHTTTSTAAQEDESAVGIRIVDCDTGVGGLDSSVSPDESSQAVLEEPDNRCPNQAPDKRVSRPSRSLQRAHSPVIDDIIVEEPSPTAPARAAQYEESRDVSLTKLSDTSDQTIQDNQADVQTKPQPLFILHPDGCRDLVTPQTAGTAEQSLSLETFRLGTSTSSIADTRTVSSWTTGDGGHENRVSVDDVPSLTSSRSTMISTMHANASRRDVTAVHPLSSSMSEEVMVPSRQDSWKRSSIQSLSQLVGGLSSSRSRTDDRRPRTAAFDGKGACNNASKKKENRLKKFMFWKSKHRPLDSQTNS